MKTEREKLIDLLDMIFGHLEESLAEYIADMLLANGVKIPVTCGECASLHIGAGGEYFCVNHKGLIHPAPHDYCAYGMWDGHANEGV